MTNAYIIDARQWPRELDILFGTVDAHTTWVSVDDVPGRIGWGVTVDFDAEQRCCGLEIWDVGLIAPWRDGAVGPVARTVMLPAVASEFQRRIEDWSRKISSYAGAEDEHVSVHWQSRRGYDYSAELEDLEDEAKGWLRVGLDGSQLLVGIRVEAPRDHVRGLQF